MGMMIEGKAIETLNEIIDEGWLISDMEKCTAIDACELAINRIRKYQKIEEIMRELDGDFYGSYLKDRQVLEKIYEVLKDENHF